MPRGRPKKKATESPKEEEGVLGTVVSTKPETMHGFSLNPGDEVSLNMKQRKFVFLVGRNDFELTPTHWHDTVPLDISLFDLKALRAELEAGDIVKGEAYLPAYPKADDAFQKIAKILKEPLPDFKKKLIKIVRHKGLIDGYSSGEIIQLLIKAEQEVGPRKVYQNLLQEAFDYVGGITEVTETPLKTLTIDTVYEID